MIKRIGPLLAALLVSAAAGVLLIRYDQVLREMSAAGAIAVTGVLLLMAILAMLAARYQWKAQHLSIFWRSIVNFAIGGLLLFSTFAFFAATLFANVLLSSTQPITTASLKTLLSAGPLLAGTGGVLYVAVNSALLRAKPSADEAVDFVVYTLVLAGSVALCVLLNRVGKPLWGMSVGVGVLSFMTGWVHGYIEAMDKDLRSSIRTEHRSREDKHKQKHPDRR
jgi:hypothetical protein